MMTTIEKKRLDSIDALRGFNMLFIMGGTELILSLCAIRPAAPLAVMIQRQMEHATWHGLTVYDSILPMFLFIAGLSFPFSLHRQRTSGISNGKIALRILRRSLLLILAGFVYNGFRYGWTLQLDAFRFASVLGRTGISWGIAALLYLFLAKKKLMLVAAAILILYWVITGVIPQMAGVIDPYTVEDSLAMQIDRRLLPGRLYFTTYDPEGLVGCIPASVTVLTGMLSSDHLAPRDGTAPGGRRWRMFLVMAAGLFALGLLWGQVFPVNKTLWSSSFVCVTAAISMLFFALFYYAVDIRGLKKAAFPLRVIGMNAITVYVLQAVFPIRWRITGLLHRVLWHLPEAGRDAVVWSVYILVWWLLLYILYRRKVFLKI